MQTYFLKLILFLFVFLFSGSLQATTRYVDNASTGCSSPSDTDYTVETRACGSGSDTVYDNVSSGITNTSASDTLNIRAGTYDLKITTANTTFASGTSYSDAPVVQAYLAETVTWTPTGSVILDIRAGAGVSWYIFKNIIFDGETDTSESNIFIGGTNDHIRFDGCTTQNSGSQGLLGGGDFGEFINGTVKDNGDSLSPQEHGLYIAADDYLIDGNTITGNYTFGIHVYNTGGGPDRAVVRNNIVHNNSVSGSGFELLVGSGVGHRVYNNIVYDNNAGGGILLDSGGGCDSCKIYNNTIVDNAECLFIAAGSDNNTVKNNLCWSNADDTIDDNGTANTVLDNLEGTDPLFVNATSDDFHITVNSPAKDAGADLSVILTDDIAETFRPQGTAFDVGAYEFPAAPAAPTNLRLARSGSK